MSELDDIANDLPIINQSYLAKSGNQSLMTLPKGSVTIKHRRIGSTLQSYVDAPLNNSSRPQIITNITTPNGLK